MSEIKTIWRGSTPCIRTTVPDNIAESIDSMIFSLKTGNTIIQKAYPGNVTKVGNVYHVGFSQNDTEQLENGKCTFQVQYNYKNSNVSYSNIIMYIADTPNNIEIIGDGSTKGTTDFIDVTITADNVVLATDGITFTPVVTSPSNDKLTLSWENDGGAENPESVTITAPKGTDGHTPVRGTDYWTEADKAVILSEAIDRTCPTGSAESLTSSLTLADCCGGTNVRNYVIHGAEGGVGDLNSDTGKYEIPVTVRGKNLMSMSRDVRAGFDSGAIVEKGVDYVVAQMSASAANTEPGSPNNSSGWIGINSLQATAEAFNKCFFKDIKPSTTYTLSYDFEYFYLPDGLTSVKHRGQISISGKSEYANAQVTEAGKKYHYKLTFTTPETITAIMFFFALNSCKVKLSNIMLEEGGSETDYERYAEPQTAVIELSAPLGKNDHVVNASGTTFKNSVLSKAGTAEIPLVASGTNTIEVGTATAPGKIEVEYYKDINKVLANLNNAILSQGGNV